MNDDRGDDSPALDAAAAAVGRRLAAVLGGLDTDGGLVAAVDEAQRAKPGLRLGDYEVVRELGAGGMGTVLLAERADGTFTRQVALKLIRGFPTEDGRRRLRQERQILAELDHPAIARLLDGGETPDGQPYLVMEYVEGQGLLEHVAAHALDRRARIALWRRLAEAVAHAHQRLVVHRDLKPSNVLVRPDGAPKLLDFGVAKLVDLSADDRQTSTRVYSPGYASPEQLAGRAVTTRTDVHALGTLLRELLLARRGDDRPSEPPFTAVAVDADLLAIVTKARAEEPGERYATIDALLEDVARWEEGLPVLARPGHPLHRARKLLWRWRVPAGLALAAVIAVAAFVVQLRASRDRARDAEATARAAQARAEGLLGFVTSTFEAAAPEAARGQSLTVVELLASAEARIAEAPAADAPALLVLLSELHGELGERGRALELIRSATTAVGEPKDAATGRWLAATLGRATGNLASEERTERAIAVGLRAEALRARFAPDDVELKRGIDVQRGLAYHHAGQVDLADALLRPITTSTPGADRASFDDVVLATRILAAVERDRGNGAASLAVAERLRRVLSRLPASHPRQRMALEAEGAALRLLGQWDAAIARYEAAIAVFAPTVGGKGSSLATLYNELAVAASDAGRNTLAADAMERAVAIEGPGDGPARAWLLGNLAAMLDGDGRYARAEAVFREALRAGGDDWAPERRNVMRSALARTLTSLGRYDEARRELLAIRPHVRPKDRVLVGIRLAQLEISAGRPREAEPYLVDVEQAIPRDAPFPPYFRGVRRVRAQQALADGRPEAALAALDTLLPECIEAYGASSLDADVVRAEQALALAALGRQGEARALLAEILPRMRTAVGPDEFNLARATKLAANLAK